jgi:hypothetical protein
MERIPEIAKVKIPDTEFGYITDLHSNLNTFISQMWMRIDRPSGRSSPLVKRKSQRPG